MNEPIHPDAVTPRYVIKFKSWTQLCPAHWEPKDEITTLVALLSQTQEVNISYVHGDAVMWAAKRCSNAGFEVINDPILIGHPTDPK